MGPAIFTDNHEDYHRYLRSIGRNVCLACCKAIGFANPVVQRKSLFSPEPINEMGNKERAKSQQNQLYASQSQQFQKLDSTKMVAPASSKKITPQQSEVHAAQCDAQSSSRQCNSCGSGAGADPFIAASKNEATVTDLAAMIAPSLQPQDAETFPGLELTIPIRDTSTEKPAITMRSGTNSPVDNKLPTDVDKCPRCSAEGYTGQCHSCGYGTGIGLQMP